MDQYRQLGYNADVLERNLEFDEEFENNVVNMFICDYSLMVLNQEDRQDDYKLKAYRYKNKKNPHVVKNIAGDTLTGGEIEMEGASFNEYYYQKTLETVNNEYNKAISDGKSFKQSLTSIYKKMQGMSNSVYKEALKNLQVEAIENASTKEKKKAKYKYTKRRLSIIKQIAYLKEIELANITKEIEKLNKQLEKYDKELESKKNINKRKVENKPIVVRNKEFNTNESKKDSQESLSTLNKEINKQS